MFRSGRLLCRKHCFSGLVWPDSCDKGVLSPFPRGPVNRRKAEIERRTWSRLPIAIPVFVRTKDESGQEFLEFASALNISAGGALIAVRRSPPLSSTVSLEIPSAPLASVASSSVDSRNMTAEAIRISHAEDYHLVALKFLTPFPTDCIDDAPPKRKVRFPGVKSFSYAEAVK
jgi:hypothetical protein